MDAISLPPLDSSIPSLPFHRISVERYHQMLDCGVLTDADRVELLDGLLVDKMTKNPPHTAATEQTRILLGSVLPAGWYARAQDPITLATSEPEPDLAVVLGGPKDYKTKHPGIAEIAFVAEVADASLSRDRGFKYKIYAQAGIPIYWIVNLIDMQIEVYSDPSPDEAVYRNRSDLRGSDLLPVLINGREIGRIAVVDCLP